MRAAISGCDGHPGHHDEQQLQCGLLSRPEQQICLHCQQLVNIAGNLQMSSKKQSDLFQTLKDVPCPKSREVQLWKLRIVAVNDDLHVIMSIMSALVASEWMQTYKLLAWTYCASPTA